LTEQERKKALNQNIKIISAVILMLFVGIMGYMLYFQSVMAEEIAKKPGNVRMQVARNEILRGTFFDRHGRVLSSSERVSSNKQVRSYAGKEAFAQVLGYEMGSVRTGLEHAMDEVLMTDEFTYSFTRDSLEELLRNPASILHRSKEGNSVVTTLDQELQWRAYELFGDALGEKGSLVAIKPKTGEILAMVNRPSYDPNRLNEDFEKLNEKNYDDGVFINQAAQGAYAPGSTFKIITLLAALERLKDVDTRTFVDEGVLVVQNGQNLPNINGIKHGRIDLQRAFAVSSNVVFGSLAIELGGNVLAGVAERFGFNEVLEAPFLYTGKSQVTPFQKEEEGALASSGVGQNGVAASPLQMAMVTSGIANDGDLMTPRIVRSILRYDGTTKEKYDPTLYKSVASVDTAQRVKAYMKNNVDSSNHPNMNMLADIRGAGKTGTAEDRYLLTSGESINVVNSWFTGFAPFEDPKIAIAVVVIDGGSGIEKAASIAAELMTWYMNNR